MFIQVIARRLPTTSRVGAPQSHPEVTRAALYPSGGQLSTVAPPPLAAGRGSWLHTARPRYCLKLKPNGSLTGRAQHATPMEEKLPSLRLQAVGARLYGGYCISKGRAGRHTRIDRATVMERYKRWLPYSQATAFKRNQAAERFCSVFH